MEGDAQLDAAGRSALLLLMLGGFVVPGVAALVAIAAPGQGWTTPLAFVCCVVVPAVSMSVGFGLAGASSAWADDVRRRVLRRAATTAGALAVATVAIEGVVAPSDDVAVPALVLTGMMMACVSLSVVAAALLASAHVRRPWLF
jgi:cytochrome bd-type quinol oxidase subunit 2